MSSNNKPRAGAWFARAAIAAAVSASSGLAFAPSAHAQTFSETLVLALEGSPDIDAQREAIRGLDEAVAIARAGMRPAVTATGSGAVTFTDTSEAPAGDDGQGASGAFSLSVTGSQRLYDGGQTRAAVEAAYAAVQAGRFQLLGVEQTVLLEAVTAYLNVLQAQQNVRLARNNVDVVARQLAAARDRFEVGEVTRTDVAQAEAQLAESRSNLVTRQGELRAAQQTFARIVGQMPEHLSQIPHLPELPTSLDEALTIAEDRHPSILAARATVESAGFSVEQALAALGPRVQWDSSATVTETHSGVDTTSSIFTGSTSIVVTVPIFQGGSSRAAVRQGEALEDQRFHELRDTVRVIREQVGLAWIDLQTARAVIVSAQERVRAELVAFEGVSEEARVGSRTTLDVLDAEQDLLDARVALVTAQTNEQIAAYTLLSAIGLLSAETLALDVETYDAAELYEQSQEFDAGVEEVVEDDDDDWQNNWRP